MQGDAGSAFSRASELSSTIGEYLEKIVALANEIPPLWQISPRLSSNYVRVTDVLLPSLRELVAEVIASRRLSSLDNQDPARVQQDSSNAGMGGREKADLLGVLVQQPDLTDADIRSILFDVVIAGSDTTASTTTAALYVLHQEGNEKWLRRAREEAVAANAADDVALEEIRTKLPVATAVAREILRLYPPVPFVGRTATEDSFLCDGRYPVFKGETYCFSPWFLGRDPKAWGGDKTRASQFDPQRWLDDAVNGQAPSTFSWLPFGAGPRGCLGTRLGLTEVTLGIARLLRDWDFEFTKTSGPLPVKYDLTLNLAGLMECKVTKVSTTREPRGKM
jgi:cytochrome P450